MAAPYDPTNPADTSFVSAFPTNERAQRLGTEAAYLHEHVIRANGTGQHKIGHGTNAVRDASPFDPWTSEAAGVALWSKSDTTDMTVDLLYLVPGTGGGSPTWESILIDALMGRQNSWAKAQAQTYLTATGAPASAVMDFNLGNFFYFVFTSPGMGPWFVITAAPVSAAFATLIGASGCPTCRK